jgi:hypothetical protein
MTEASRTLAALYPTYKRLMGAGTRMATERAATLARRYPALRERLAGELSTCA